MFNFTRVLNSTLKKSPTDSIVLEISNNCILLIFSARFLFFSPPMLPLLRWGGGGIWCIIVTLFFTRAASRANNNRFSLIWVIIIGNVGSIRDFIHTFAEGLPGNEIGAVILLNGCGELILLPWIEPVNSSPSVVNIVTWHWRSDTVMTFLEVKAAVQWRQETN